MTITRTKAAKSARRTALTLLGAIVVLGFAAYAFAAAGKPDFALESGPSTQTVDQGGSTSFTVSATRKDGHADPISLQVSGLPAGATGTWKNPNGTTTTQPTLTMTTTTLSLVVATSSSTPVATTKLTITATSGSLVKKADVSLKVVAPKAPTFSFSLSPSTQSVLPGDDTNFALTFDRSGGYTGGIDLSVDGLPGEAKPTWQPSSKLTGSQSSATLLITTTSKTPDGVYPLVITAKASDKGSSVTQKLTATLEVYDGQAPRLSGNVAGLLAPGRTGSIDLVLTNPNKFALNVTGITVVIDGTGKAGCSATNDFSVAQMTPASFPIKLQPFESATLTQLAVSNGKAISKPAVSMLNRTVNQDACKNATLQLKYSGSATK